MNIWIREGLRHITPRGLECPEGFDVWQILSDMVGSDTVKEIGCGRGRLARAFDPNKYTGLDINPRAIVEARKANPKHRFGVVCSCKFDVTLLYTVALHVKNFDALELDTPRVIIAEIMNPELARPTGIPPAYNRSEAEYERLMAERGYKRKASHYYPYDYYDGEPFTFLEFVRCE